MNKQLKILVCDDDPGVLEVMKIILEDNNYNVETLDSGRAIKKRVEEYNPDLLFLDIWMPGIDGKEITKLLKKDLKTKYLPIVIISALNDTAKIAKEIGADDFLAKPFSISEIVACVEKNAGKEI